MSDYLKIALAQITPHWLKRSQTLSKIEEYVAQAAAEHCDLVTFGEALLPGYPFWVERSNGAQFNSPKQKELFALYSDQAVQIERGDLGSLQALAKDKQISIVLGTIEKAPDRGGHSLYCSLVYINKAGEIPTVHRKLRPTYEERLVWSPGDGHGLNVHSLGKFTLGALNCWENWMPLVRSALYAQGEDLHIAIWPGGWHNTQDLTRFIAKESRSYVVSVSGLMRKSDIPTDFPYAEEIIQAMPQDPANGGSAVSDPAGNWVLEPQVGEEGLYTVEINHLRVREERQNFDPSGHYSRPDVTQLHLNKTRQSVLKIQSD